MLQVSCRNLVAELAELFIGGTCSRLTDGSLSLKEREEEGLGVGSTVLPGARVD